MTNAWWDIVADLRANPEAAERQSSQVDAMFSNGG